MIGVTSTLGGPELGGRLRVDDCSVVLIDRLSFNGYPEASVYLSFLVPGSITSPGFEGVRVGRIQRGPPAWLDARIGVPAAETKSERLPDLLLDLAAEAVADVAERYRRAHIQFDAGHALHIDRVRLSLASNPVQRHVAGTRPELQDLVGASLLEPSTIAPLSMESGHQRTPFRQSLTLNLALGSKLGKREELEPLIAFEDRLELALTKAGDAELEGNEIGEGSFTFFIVCRSASRTWGVVKPMLESLSVLPGSYVELERPGSTRRLDLPTAR